MANPAYSGEEDVNKITLASIPYGRTIQRSPFVSISKIGRILKKVTDKIISMEDLSRAQMAVLLKRAAMQTDEVIARNIKRNPELSKFYEKLLEQGAQPIKLNLNEVTK